MEGVAVLRELLTRFDVVADEPDVPKVRNITSVPRHGSRITVHAR
jgi:cytochrome P450